MKIKKVLFSIAFSVLIIMTCTHQRAFADDSLSSIDTESEGEVYDGIDFEALLAGNIYYGAYYHAREGRSTGFGHKATAHDDYQTPLLWIVLGEENTDGMITSISEYIIDTAGFATQNTRASCSGCPNPPFVGAADYIGDTYYRERGAILLVELLEERFNDSFNADTGAFAAEKAIVYPADVATYFVDFRNDAVYSIPPAHFADGNWRTWYGYTGKTWPHILEDATVYIPFGYPNTAGNVDGGKMYWSADGINNDKYLFGVNGINTIGATFKYGEERLTYWLRTPNSESDVQPFVVESNETMDYIYPNVFATDEAGVRPIFKLDPTKIIMMHEVVDTLTLPSQIKNDKESNDFWNYTSDDEKKNYKLTILSNNVELKSLEHEGEVISTSSIQIDSDGITLTSSDFHGDYLAYKIVQENEDGNRFIVAYGTSKNANASDTLFISGLKNETDNSSLSAGGNYTLYVWAQAEDSNGKIGESVHSFEGSMTLILTIDVGSVANSPEYTLTYHANTVDVVAQMPNILSKKYEENETAYIASMLPQREGHEFIGWNSQADGSGSNYSAGEALLITADIDLFAQWRRKVTTPETGNGSTDPVEIVTKKPTDTGVKDNLLLQMISLITVLFVLSGILLSFAKQWKEK